MPSFRKKFRNKLVTRKKKAAQQFRRGSKTFRHNKNLRQNISVKKLYTKGKNVGKQYRRVTRGFLGGINDEEKEEKQKQLGDDIRAALSSALKYEKMADLALSEGRTMDAVKAQAQAHADRENAAKLNKMLGDWSGGARNAYKRRR